MTAGLVTIAGAYLLGGVPFGYLLFRLLRGGDIREVGSGNIGATNILRSAGWAPGVVTLLLDAGKGALAVWAGRAVTGSTSWAAAAGMAAVAGHCFPAALRFRGGKGVATGCGAFFVLQPAGMAIALGAFAATLALTRMVSAGSIVASMSFPVAAAALGEAPPTALWAGAACLLIIARHHENIRRILRGEEGRLRGGGGRG